MGWFCPPARVLLPARLPGIDLPEVTNLQEVNAMLAERVMEWTEEWKSQGIKEGVKKGIKKGRQVCTALVHERLVLWRVLSKVEV